MTKAKAAPRKIVPNAIIEKQVVKLWNVGQAALYHIKKGIQVTKARVALTHANAHMIWSGSSERSRRIRQRYPLEVSMSRIGAEPEVINCRQFIVPWDVPLRGLQEVINETLQKALTSPDPKQYLEEHPEMIEELRKAISRDPIAYAGYRSLLESHPSPADRR